jgi:hypothetical protein
MPQYANTERHGGPDFYGGLKDLEAARLDDAKKILRHLLRAEQRRARRLRRQREDRRSGQALRRAC